jgi:hypothetical protein
VQQQHALYEVEGTEDKKIILPITTLGHKPVQRANQAHSHIPLETLLQLEEFAKRRIARQLGEILTGARSCRLVRAATTTIVGCSSSLWFRVRKADLRQQTLHLAQSLADLGPVVGGEVIECEGE